MIEERIEDLNRTLRRVDFQPACYLRLQPQRVVQRLLDAIDPRYHRLIVRQPSLTEDKRIAEILTAAKVALELTPGCARGRPCGPSR